MDAFGALGEVLDDYRNFVTGFLEIKDDDIRAKVESEIADGLLWPEPWLALTVYRTDRVERFERIRTTGDVDALFARSEYDEFPVANKGVSHANPGH